MDEKLDCMYIEPIPVIEKTIEFTDVNKDAKPPRTIDLMETI